MNSRPLAMVLFVLAAGAQTIPALHSSSLDGNSVNLPADLAGRTCVLVVGFTKNSGTAAKGWGDALTKVYEKTPQVAYYQVPVLAVVPKWIRGAVLSGMRRHMTEQEKAHFVPAFNGEDEWKRATRCTSGDDAYVLVLDSKGEVRWRAQGRLTPSLYDGLRQCVKVLVENSAQTSH